MNIIAGLILTAVLAFYSSTLYSLALKERAADRRELLELHWELLKLHWELRADFETLRDHLNVEITHNEPETETADEPVADEPTTQPINIPTPDGPPTVPDHKAAHTVQPISAKWDREPTEPPADDAHQVIADDWQKQQDADYERYIAEIRGGTR